MKSSTTKTARFAVVVKESGPPDRVRHVIAARIEKELSYNSASNFFSASWLDRLSRWRTIERPTTGGYD
jgi:hypothetical protein